MYTLCWTGNGIDGWSIFKTIQELEDKVKELMIKGFSEEDMMIFDTREYVVPIGGKVFLR